MDEAVSAAVAKRKFSQLLQNVRQGCSYIVTSRKTHCQDRSCRRSVEDSGQRTGDFAGQIAAAIRNQGVRWTRDELFRDRQ